MYLKKEKNYYLTFFSIYILVYGLSAIFTIYIPLYFDYLKFNKTSIGILMAVGPLSNIISQPLWGTLCDRVKIKNYILYSLLLCSGISFLLFPISNNFSYLLAIITAFVFFERPIYAIYDTITLEYIETSNWKYGHIRLAGSLGYSLVAMISGYLIKLNIYNAFIIYFCLSATNFILSSKLPKIKGHQSGEKKIFLLDLFKNRELVLLLSFNMIVQITFAFYNYFFSIYYKQAGADDFMVGFAIFLATMSEVVFLVFADRIIKFLNIKILLLISAALTATRWLSLYYFSNIYIILIVQILYGFTFIVFMFTSTCYVNTNVKKELKASGQTINMLISMGISPVIGSIVGGRLSDMLGIRQVFLCSSLLIVIATIIFVIIFAVKERVIYQQSEKLLK